MAIISFWEPADNGSGILSYTATCQNGQSIGTGTASTSPVIVTGLTNGVVYTCSVTATNAIGTGAVSTSVNVTPASTIVPASLVSVYSRKIHGTAGTFDLALDMIALIGGEVTVEPRAIGMGHTLLFSFDKPVASAGGITVRNAAMNNVGAASATTAGKNVIVTLTGIPNNSRLTVSVPQINGVPSSAAVSIGFLIGDVNNTRSVGSSDIAAIKAHAGQIATTTNFIFDLNSSGAINATDVTTVKRRAGQNLTP